MFVPDPDLDVLPIPNLVSWGQKGTGSRTRNIGEYNEKLWQSGCFDCCNRAAGVAILDVANWHLARLSGNTWDTWEHVLLIENATQHFPFPRQYVSHGWKGRWPKLILSIQVQHALLVYINSIFGPSRVQISTSPTSGPTRAPRPTWKCASGACPS